jgi:oligosaccharyltransferase complex subunit beta
MRSFTSLITLVVSSLFVLSEAKSVSGNRVLVLLDAVSEKDIYNQFWTQLEGTCFLLMLNSTMSHCFFFLNRFWNGLERDFDLTFSSADDAQAQLVYFGEDIFNHIIHFAPNSKGNLKRVFTLTLHLNTHTYLQAWLSTKPLTISNLLTL